MSYLALKESFRYTTIIFWNLHPTVILIHEWTEATRKNEEQVTFIKEKLPLLQKVNIELPSDPAIPLPDIHPSKMKLHIPQKVYMNVYSSIIHNKQKAL